MGLLTEQYKVGGIKRYNFQDLYDVFQTLQSAGEPRTFDKFFGTDLITAFTAQTIDLNPEQRTTMMYAILIRDYARGFSLENRNFMNNVMLNKGTQVSTIPETTPNP